MRDHINWFHFVKLDTDRALQIIECVCILTELKKHLSIQEIIQIHSNNAINKFINTFGRRTSAQGSDGMRFDGYMAEINFIDGQQYDASMGYTDTLKEYGDLKDTKVIWTNGFHLDFSILH